MKNKIKSKQNKIKDKKNREGRIKYVDIFRGVAVFIMIVIQIFDVLSVSNIYTTPPYYIKAINSVTFLPPSILFTFVAGMSVLLLVEKRKKQRKKIGLEIFKKYFKYIVLSFFFTLIMWNIGVWINWEEAVQGIALTAIVFGLLLVVLRNFNYILGLLLILVSIFLHYTFKIIVSGSSLASIFTWPTAISQNVGLLFGGIILNAFVRGWFSILNLLPMFIGGALFLKLLFDKKIKIAFFTSLLFLFVSFVMNFLGLRIDYYNRSLSFSFFAVGLAMFFFSLIYMIYNSSKEWRGWGFFNNLGLVAFFVYIFHYLIIIKLIRVFGLNDLLNDWLAWILVVPCVAFVYFASRFYLRYRKKLPSFLRI